MGYNRFKSRRPAMEEKPDISVIGPDSERKLVVEVKNKRDATDEWAARLYQNMRAHSSLLASPYFLLAVPDTIYLWKNEPGESSSEPLYKAVLSEAISSLIDDIEPYQIGSSGLGLELLVSTWLNTLAISSAEELHANPSSDWLFDTGLFDAIKDGTISSSSSE